MKFTSTSSNISDGTELINLPGPALSAIAFANGVSLENPLVFATADANLAWAALIFAEAFPALSVICLTAFFSNNLATLGEAAILPREGINLSMYCPDISLKFSATWLV